jgi:dihydrofolate reductase
VELFCQRECQWHRRAGVWQSHLRPYGKVLADAAGDEELSGCGRRDEQSPKMVFSRTLDKVSWKNTKLVKGDLVEEVQKIKKEPGPDMVILGSGSIVSQLAKAGLIDEYQVALSPILLGKGRTMFEGVKQNVNLKKTRAFGNGKVMLWYEPAA